MPTPPSLLFTCAALNIAFTLVAAVDGLYYHLWRYRLYERPESRREHWLHTGNALCFPLLSFLLLSVDPRGALRALALALFLLTLAFESLDVLCERASRASLGGLTPREYLLHFLMAGLRGASLVPLLALPGWALSETALGPRPPWAFCLGLGIAVPGLAVAALHVWLGLSRRRVVRPVGLASAATPQYPFGTRCSIHA